MAPMVTEPSQLTDMKAEFLRQLAEMTTDQKLVYIALTLWELSAQFDEFRPLLDKYKRASDANGLFKARKEMRR